VQNEANSIGELGHGFSRGFSIVIPRPSSSLTVFAMFLTMKLSLNDRGSAGLPSSADVHAEVEGLARVGEHGEARLKNVALQTQAVDQEAYLGVKVRYFVFDGEVPARPVFKWERVRGFVPEILPVLLRFCLAADLQALLAECRPVGSRGCGMVGTG